MAERETIADLKSGDYKKTPAKETFDELKFNERWPTTEMAQYEMQDPILDRSGIDYFLPEYLKIPKGLAKAHEGGRQPTIEDLVRIFTEGTVSPGVPMIPSTVLARGLGFLLGNKPKPQPYLPRRVPTREYI